MVAGADSIDDLDLVRHGGMPALFEQVYAPGTVVIPNALAVLASLFAVDVAAGVGVMSLGMIRYAALLEGTMLAEQTVLRKRRVDLATAEIGMVSGHRSSGTVQALIARAPGGDIRIKVCRSLRVATRLLGMSCTR